MFDGNPSQTQQNHLSLFFGKLSCHRFHVSLAVRSRRLISRFALWVFLARKPFMDVAVANEIKIPSAKTTSFDPSFGFLAFLFRVQDRFHVSLAVFTLMVGTVNALPRCMQLGF